MVVHVRLKLVSRDCDVTRVFDECLGGSWASIVRGSAASGFTLHYVKVFSRRELNLSRKCIEPRLRAYKVSASFSAGGSGCIMVLRRACKLCRVVYSCRDCIVLHHSILPGGHVSILVAAMDNDRVKELLSRLREAEKEGYFSLLAVERVEHTEMLTPLQALVLSYAVERGYYDVPRRISLGELAKELGLSRSLLADVLRRAESRAVKKFVSEGLLQAEP